MELSAKSKEFIDHHYDNVWDDEYKDRIFKELSLPVFQELIKAGNHPAFAYFLQKRKEDGSR